MDGWRGGEGASGKRWGKGNCEQTIVYEKRQTLHGLIDMWNLKIKQRKWQRQVLEGKGTGKCLWQFCSNGILTSSLVTIVKREDALQQESFLNMFHISLVQSYQPPE